MPTTRHIPPPPQSSSPSLPVSTTAESNPSPQDNGHLSPELPLHEEPVLSNPTLEDDLMPVVDTVEEEPPTQSETNSSFLIAESNECDDGKIQLDDTLPSCSSGYESAAALTNVDIHTVNNPSSDEDETDFTARSREHSSSCHSEQSLVPFVSTVSSNTQLNSNDQQSTHLSPVISKSPTRTKEGWLGALSQLLQACANPAFALQNNSMKTETLSQRFKITGYK